MKEIIHFLDPVEDSLRKSKRNGTIMNYISFFSSSAPVSLKDFSIALIGISDERNSLNHGVERSADAIRSEFYSLHSGEIQTSIIDLGNIKKGKTVIDTYRALQDVILFVIEQKVLPIVFGSSQDMMLPIARSIRAFSNPFNITIIDNKVDVGKHNAFNNLSTLDFINNEIKPFKITHIGSQSYLNPHNELQFFHDNYLPLVRLGKIRDNITSSESSMRDSQLIVFDISAIRFCDAPGNTFASPNGITSEDSCQLAKYAGISDESLCFFICEHNPTLDNRNQTANLCAQIIWHFIEGFINRKDDLPSRDTKGMKKFVVSSEQFGFNIDFYQSKKTNRWWIDVPHNQENSTNIIPCDYDDYLQACQENIPDVYVMEKSRLLSRMS